MQYIAFNARQWQHSVLVTDNSVMFWRTVWTPAFWSPQPINWTCCRESTIFTEHAQARNAAGQPTTRVQLKQSAVSLIHASSNRTRSSLTSLTARNARPTAPTGLPQSIADIRQQFDWSVAFNELELGPAGRATKSNDRANMQPRPLRACCKRKTKEGVLWSWAED